MPELPEMQALAERLDEAFGGSEVARIDPLSFSGLATVDPSPREVVGALIETVARRGKYLVVTFSSGIRMLVHLGQAGRVDVEAQAKATRGRGAIFRMVFTDGRAMLVREHGHERNARWWLLRPGEEGPLAGLGPDVDDASFLDALLAADDRRRIHTVLRDQHFAAGVGRGYADDALNRAHVSPFTPLSSLDEDARRHLADIVGATLEDALALERTREGGLSAARLGDRFRVHGRSGEPCPNACGDTLLRVSYDSYEIVYCKTCQTNGRTYADRRLSRLLR